MEKAAKEDVVADFVRLAAGADVDAVELAELRQLAKQLSGVGLHAINAMLKAAHKAARCAASQGGAGAACRHSAGSASADLVRRS